MKLDAILCRRAVAPADSGMSAALLPADQQADEALRGIALGETIAVKILRDRSLPQHRLFFGVLQHVAEASKFETAERLLVALKIRLGRFDLCRLPNGKMVPVPQSISFAKCDQDAFQKFMDAAIAAICQDVLPGTNPDDLIAEVCFQRGLPHPEQNGATAAQRGGHGDAHVAEMPDAPHEHTSGSAEPNAEPPITQPQAMPRDLTVARIMQVRNSNRVDFGATANAAIEAIRGLQPGEREAWLAANKRLLNEMQVGAAQHRARVEQALAETEE